MGFVHPKKPDVFFSYARVDDNPIMGSNLGWVRMFFQRLSFEIDKKLGRNGACHLWMDYELPANARLDEALAAQVRDSAVVVVILSEGYRKSEWCKGEMLGFLMKEVERRGTGATSGLFVVALDNEERPAQLKALNLVGKQFYEVDTFSKKVRTEWASCKPTGKSPGFTTSSLTWVRTSPPSSIVGKPLSPGTARSAGPPPMAMPSGRRRR